MEKEQLTISISRDIAKDIEKYKKRTHRKTTEAAVTDLIKYALTLPLYFKDFDWKKAEFEADEEITAGKTKSFDSVENFIVDLKNENCPH